MQWDLGLQGIGVLIAVALGFGIVAQLVMWGRATRWLWLIAAGVYFVVGLFISEVWFGSATEEVLQPNYDGLSFDEVLIGALVCTLIVLAWRFLARPGGSHRPMLP